MKKRTSLLGVMILCAVAMMAQTANIKGLITEASDGAPLGYVNVVLTKSGQTLPVAGAVSKDNGSFLLPQVANGRYKIEFSFVGYTTTSKMIVVSGKTLDLGKVVLSDDSQTLNEVQVVGQGPQMKLEADKKVFTVDQTIAAQGASASEMLQNIPSVDVDNSGNISLRNNSNVVVWIDGKPSGLTGDNQAEILQQMPAESIEKVEIIPNPSAKYDPEGSAGIINLVLKKNRKVGYYGSVTVGGVYPDKGKMGYNLGASLNYNSSKVDAFASIGIRQRDMSGGGWTDRESLNPQGQVTDILKETSSTGRTMHGPFIRAGLDYHLDTKNTIGFSGFTMLGSASMPAQIGYQVYNPDDVLLQTFSRATTASGNRNMFDINLDYKHDFDTNGTELTSSLAFSSNPSHSDAGHVQYDQFGVVTSSQDQQTKGNNPSVEYKLDFTGKVGTNGHLEAGTDDSYKENTTDITGTTDGVSDPTLSNNFDYHQQNYAAYVTYTDKWGKLGAQLGLRGEYSLINFISDGVNYNIHYIQPFPSANVNYAFDDRDQLQLTYSRRLNRPRGMQLNPYVNTSDTTNWTFGNPKLTPEYFNSLELNYMKTWDDHSLSASVYYHLTTNVIQSVSWLDNTGIMMTTPMNGSKSEAEGLELILKDNFFRFIDLTTTLNLFYTQLHASTFYENKDTINIGSQESFAWNVKSIANVMLPANFAFQVIGNYNAPYILAQGKNLGNYSVDFGLRKTFLNRKLTANFTIRDIFNSRKDRVDSWGSGYTQQSLSYYNGRMFGINLTYNFGSQGKNKKPRKTQQSDENNSDNMMNDMQ